MSASLYHSELTNILSESKRKNHELRSAADKSIQDLKAITVTSEAQLAAELAKNATFIDPFVKACETGNPKLAVSGVNGLQRLVISQGLPKDKLHQALQAFNACTELGLDIQLKVLQALPSLLQNYADELRGDLLSSALQVCASLQGAKVSTVSAVAAATLQQLVTAVFTRLAAEDAHSQGTDAVIEVPGEQGPILLRPAAYDAYRVFQDLVLAAEGRKTKFVQLSTLTRENCLELVESSIEAKPRLVATHEELASILRSSVIPLVTTALSEQLSFPFTVRCLRIVRLLCTRHFRQFVSDLDVVLGLFAHGLEPECPTWKRVLLMEILRDMFAESGLVVLGYMAFDQEGKSIIQDLMACFVRLSAEKPAVIGLGQQSTSPAGPPTNREQGSEEGNGDVRAGMAGMLSSFGVAESSIQGISSQWSVPKSACYEQLDKSDAPALPETYIYSLVLECLNGLSESLAKVVLPLTVHRNRESSHSKQPAEQNGIEQDSDDQTHPSVPLNPLDLEDSPAVFRAKAVAALIESCWPAVLATCSTFMNAALDDGFYRSLVKSYQRFAQVAGLLRLSTPRDALMTTLGKSAVPPHVLNAVYASGEGARSPVAESPRIFSNSKNLLSIESLVSQASSTLSGEKDRRSSLDAVKPVLTVRNLLCLRALLNLAIALGPTLGSAFTVVVDVLKQADIVLSASGAQQTARSSTFSANSQSDPPALVQSFSAEVSAVEQAASRLLESTADYPDEAFVVVLDAFCRILRSKPPSTNTVPESPSIPSSPIPRQRTFSGLPGISSFAELQSKNIQFVLPKLATLAALNVPRFVTSSPRVSGWQILTGQVLTVAISNTSPSSARRPATDLLCKLSAECISAVSQATSEERQAMQLRCFTLLLDIVRGIYDEEGQLTNIDLEVQSHVVAASRAILERSGDTIVAGWDRLLAIVSSAFDSELGLAVSDDNDAITIIWSKLSSNFVSPRLGRDAFGAFQLICAEFFTLLPPEAAVSVIELLSRFMVQKEDLNLSLTGINVAWNVSDRLFDGREVDIRLPQISEDEDGAVGTALSELSVSSRTGQWLLSLAKLRTIVRQGQREPAKAAFQTICSISRNNGAHVPINVWAFVLRHILIGVLADQSATDSASDEDLTPVILAGTAEVLAHQIELFDELSDMDSLWSSYLAVLKRLLDSLRMDTVCAVYQNLTTVLLHVKAVTSKWQKPVLQTASIWRQHDPSQVELVAGNGDNQPMFRAYAALASQLLRLLGADVEVPLAHAVINNLSSCVKSSHASFYGADIPTLSPLQREVLEILRSLPLELKGISSQLITVAIEFAKLHSSTQTNNSQPSFVALAVTSLAWIGSLVNSICQSAATIDTRAVEQAIECLADLVEEKYRFQIESKGIWLWRQAESTAVELSPTISGLLANGQIDEQSRTQIMTQYVGVIRNTLLANGLETFHNEARIYDDETSDITSFHGMAKVFIPGLCSDRYPQELRVHFVRSLFEASIIHSLERGELSLDIANKPLEGLDKVRRGRAKKINPCRRERMSYECFVQLVKLASPPSGVENSQLLAQAAAPWLIARLAVPIRAYIADQPLRSRMPQPLSELEELLYSFEQIQQLRLDPVAFAQDAENRQIDGSRAHWHYLYPLLAQAVRVAGDKWCGSSEVLVPLQRVLEAYRS